MKRLSILIACLQIHFSLSIATLAAEGIEKRFASPPEGTKPRCYWYWIDGNISREGITHDLEAMQRVGIGEAYIGIIGGGEATGIIGKSGGVECLGELWWNMMEHALREGGRLGVDIGIFNSPGWSQSGGPWVKPNQAMRYLVMPELRLHGPRHFEEKLPTPPGAFQDVAVLAFPAPVDDADSVGRHSPRIACMPEAKDAELLFDGNSATACTLPGGQITLELAEPFTARSVIVHPLREVNVSCELQASEDGLQFRTVRKFAIDRHNLSIQVGPAPLAPIAVALPATRARFFRFVFSAGCTLGEIGLSAAPRLEKYAEKQLLKTFQDPQPAFDSYLWASQPEPESADLSVNPEAVRDISRQMTPDGTLCWDVPAGDWIVLRTAMTPTGVRNSPAPPEATGLEVDKMNRDALRSHFVEYLGKLLKRMPAAERKALKHVVADSYETGPENWTDDFARDFQRRYGYDPKSFLPAMSGRIVGSADRSDRFLWDLRRLVADRIARDYVGGLRDLCHEHGLRMWLENYGHWGFPAEFLQYGGASDEISGEFWATGDLGKIELRDASSAGHIYDKPVIFSEAFTGGPLFTSHPGSLKARGDWTFCQGVNQFVLHVYIHQPWDDRRPGMSAAFGTEFNRHNTWFDLAKAWIDYQRRCSVLLQHGKYVADVAYFIGEDTPKMTGICKPELPPGYSFDYINAEVIENLLQVKDGRFVLPDGMSYRLLVLPHIPTMRPALLKKLRDLTAAGGAILGAPPARSPSMEGYPQCDQEVRQIAAELWGTCDGVSVTRAAFGRGWVFRGVELLPALSQLNAPPDLAGIDPGKILFLHRKAPDADIYFLSNQSAQAVDLVPTFRIAGKAPEFWDAATGRIARPAVYDTGEDGTSLPIHLDPSGSIFVVFREQASADRIIAATRNGEPLLEPRSGDSLLDTPLELVREATGRIEAKAWREGVYEIKTADGRSRSITVPELPAPLDLTGPWEVHFPADSGIADPTSFDNLRSWTDCDNPRIKYFSGAAVYEKTFDIPADKLGKGQTLQLDLGRVEIMAEVILNDKNLGTLWKPPFRLDITEAAKPGANRLELRVVNVWHNRLVGQAKQPEAYADDKIFKPTVIGPPGCSPNDPLFPSGLLGPVCLRVIPVIRIENRLEE